MSAEDTEGNAVATLLIENERVRVTEWRFPGKEDSTGWHTHEHDYVIVPLFTGTLKIDNPDGSSNNAELVNGVPYYRDTGIRHNVINGNNFECAFVEIEILGKQ